MSRNDSDYDSDYSNQNDFFALENILIVSYASIQDVTYSLSPPTWFKCLEEPW